MFGIRQWLENSGGRLALVPATPTELQEREAERIKAYNQRLLNASPLELKELARQERETRKTAQQVEIERMVKATEERDASIGFPKLPEINSETGERLDAAYFKKLSDTDMGKFRNYMRRYGSSNITARLNGVR
jgi:hypothetical protein